MFSYKNRLFKSIANFLFRETETSEYVFHPVNAFHLLKRMSKWIPKIAKLLPEFEVGFKLPSVTDAYVGAAHGLADIHEHFNLDPLDMAKGRYSAFHLQ